MRAFRTLALAALCAACSTSAEPAAGDLIGRWATTPEAMQPAGTMRSSLDFLPDGRFTAEVRMLGVYPRQPAGELSSYTKTVGTYRTAGDRLILTPTELRTWDRFYGADSPETVQTPVQAPSAPSGYYDDARFRVSGATLTLDYTTYPADAPVPTRQVYVRVQ